LRRYLTDSNPHLLSYIPLSCSNKVKARATGVPDDSTFADNSNYDYNQSTKDSCGRLLPQSACCASDNNDIKVCGDTDTCCGSPISKDACKDGCCDDKNTIPDVEGCADDCCDEDDVVDRAEALEAGCSSTTIQQEKLEDDTTCKSACCGPIVVKPLEAGYGTEKSTNRTITAAFGSSSGCCSPQHKVNYVPAPTKNDDKSCTSLCPPSFESNTPKAGCCNSMKDQPSGCYPTIPQAIEPTKKGCCGPKSDMMDTLLQEGKSSGCCSTAEISKDGDGCCDTKSSDEGGCCSPAKYVVVCSKKACCTGDSPVKPEKGCCSSGPRKGKSEQASKSKWAKSKSRAASLGSLPSSFSNNELTKQE
jgi:hypothetical protein